MVSASRLPGWACALVAVVAVISGGWIGLHLGEAFGYALARWADRDIAELKDELIWCILMGGLVCAFSGVAIALLLTGVRRWVQRTAAIAACVTTLGAGALLLAAYPWPKTSGIPVIEYELQLPPGLPLPKHSEIDLTIWSKKSGQGCYIRDVRMAGDRPEIVGDMVLQLNNLEPSVSLALNRETEGRWKLSIKPDATLDKTFGPWQRIEFIPNPNAKPLPQGDYNIRYRVRRYM